MSSPYFNLKVVEITRETSDAITVHLEHPDKKTISYKPGQFLTLILPIEGKKVRRSYSLCSAPHEGARLSVTVKRVEGGLVSNYLLDQLQVGQEIEIMEPLGNFNLVPDASQNRHIILFGAGSGITPLMSILKSVLSGEPNSKVTLLYGNRDEESVIFKKQLEELEVANPDRLHTEYIFSQPKQQCEHRGRMNQSVMLKILERLKLTRPESALYYMCCMCPLTAFSGRVL
jgi:ring-1,2-phenylacetyl-CoA epoxidase subunit PaaE